MRFAFMSVEVIGVWAIPKSLLVSCPGTSLKWSDKTSQTKLVECHRLTQAIAPRIYSLTAAWALIPVKRVSSRPGYVVHQ